MMSHAHTLPLAVIRCIHTSDQVTGGSFDAIVCWALPFVLTIHVGFQESMQWLVTQS